MSTYTLKRYPLHTLIVVATTEHPSFICIRMLMKVYIYARRHTFSNPLISCVLITLFTSIWRTDTATTWETRRKTKELENRYKDSRQESTHETDPKEKDEGEKKYRERKKIVMSFGVAFRFYMNIRLQRCTDIFISLCVTTYAHLWVHLSIPTSLCSRIEIDICI